MVLYIRDMIIGVALGIFVFIEIVLFLGTMIITSITFVEIVEVGYPLHNYLHVIWDNLINENTYMYPLSVEHKDKLTLVGKIFFSILWFIFWTIPFILGNIVAFPICAIVIVFKKIMFKTPKEEDKYDIDH